jgi:hypothetical protein
MMEREPNEISLGAGKSQVTLKGKEAIRAAGWTLRLLLFARAIAILSLPVAAAIYLILKMWG